MLGYDPESESHTANPDVHVRLYLSQGRPTVICVQDFDYPDYDMNMLLSNRAWKSESDANDALRLLIADAAALTSARPLY